MEVQCFREIQDLSTNWYFINVYIKTHMRATAYCFGLIFGYIIHRIQETGYKLPKKILIPGWILGPSCLLISMSSVLIFYDPSYKYDIWESSTYSALHRTVWCLGTGWILLACITNNGGKRFLNVPGEVVPKFFFRSDPEVAVLEAFYTLEQTYLLRLFSKWNRGAP